jgi:hypothetical protein
VLVKAYPQPSQKYQETVCVAAVTEAHELVSTISLLDALASTLFDGLPTTASRVL